MARLPRLTLPGYVHHVIQRGNNHQAIFEASSDFDYFLNLLWEYAPQFEVDIHSFVLMKNHFHLLVTPHTTDGLAVLMQTVGRRYVRYFNVRQHRTGTLWEGRYKSTVIQSERYLIACMVYMDLNPVRANLVQQAQAYVWSSHGHYIGIRHSNRITPHPMYWALGNTPFARETAYLQRTQLGLTDVQIQVLTQAVLTGWAIGDDKFLQTLQKLAQRRVFKLKAGRPSAAVEIDVV